MYRNICNFALHQGVMCNYLQYMANIKISVHPCNDKSSPVHTNAVLNTNIKCVNTSQILIGNYVTSLMQNHAQTKYVKIKHFIYGKHIC